MFSLFQVSINNIQVFNLYFTVGESMIWARDCYTPPDSFVGCREEQRHDKPAAVCYCEGDLCNAKMDDITTTTSTTHKTSTPTISTSKATTTKTGKAVCNILKLKVWFLNVPK